MTRRLVQAGFQGADLLLQVVHAGLLQPSGLGVEEGMHLVAEPPFGSLDDPLDVR